MIVDCQKAIGGCGAHIASAWRSVSPTWFSHGPLTTLGHLYGWGDSLVDPPNAVPQSWFFCLSIFLGLAHAERARSVALYSTISRAPLPAPQHDHWMSAHQTFFSCTESISRCPLRLVALAPLCFSEGQLVRPEAVQAFAQRHDDNLWQCLCSILGISEDLCDEVARVAASLPLALGGLGLRSAVRSSVAAHWANWADTLPIIQDRHPVATTKILHSLEGRQDHRPHALVLQAGQHTRSVVSRWALVGGLRPPPREPED